jgi:hypothetical protein
MKQLIFLFSVFVSPLAWSISYIPTGCQYELDVHYKTDDNSSASYFLSHGFDIEGRQGWGRPMV